MKFKELIFDFNRVLLLNTQIHKNSSPNFVKNFEEQNFPKNKRSIRDIYSKLSDEE